MGFWTREPSPFWKRVMTSAFIFVGFGIYSYFRANTFSADEIERIIIILGILTGKDLMK